MELIRRRFVASCTRRPSQAGTPWRDASPQEVGPLESVYEGLLGPWQGSDDSPFLSNISIEFLNFQLRFLPHRFQLEFEYHED